MKIGYCEECQEKYKLSQRTRFKGENSRHPDSGEPIVCDVCGENVNVLSFVDAQQIFELLASTQKKSKEPIALFDMDGTLCDYDFAMERDLRKICSPEETFKYEAFQDSESDWLRARRKLIKDQPGWWRKRIGERVGERIGESVFYQGIVRDEMELRVRSTDLTEEDDVENIIKEIEKACDWYEDRASGVAGIQVGKSESLSLK